MPTAIPALLEPPAIPGAPSEARRFRAAVREVRIHPLLRGVCEPSVPKRRHFKDAGEPRSARLTHGHHLDAQRVGSVPGLFGALLAVQTSHARSGVADDDPPTRGAAPASHLTDTTACARALRQPRSQATDDNTGHRDSRTGSYRIGPSHHSHPARPCCMDQPAGRDDPRPSWPHAKRT
jgi:hypothetical protein